MLSIIRANCDNLNNRVHRPLMTLGTQVKHGRKRQFIPSVILIRDGALLSLVCLCISVSVLVRCQWLAVFTQPSLLLSVAVLRVVVHMDSILKISALI